MAGSAFVLPLVTAGYGIYCAVLTNPAIHEGPVAAASISRITEDSNLYISGPPPM